MTGDDAGDDGRWREMTGDDCPPGRRSGLEAKALALHVAARATSAAPRLSTFHIREVWGSSACNPGSAASAAPRPFTRAAARAPRHARAGRPGMCSAAGLDRSPGRGISTLAMPSATAGRPGMRIAAGLHVEPARSGRSRAISPKHVPSRALPAAPPSSPRIASRA